MRQSIQEWTTFTNFTWPILEYFVSYISKHEENFPRQSIHHKYTLLEKYSIRIQENTNKKNYVFGHCSHNDMLKCF